MSLMGFFFKGGVVMFLILLCSILACAIFIERLIHLYLTKKRGKDIEYRLISLLENGQEAQAIRAAEESNSPMGRIVLAALQAKDTDREIIETIIVHTTDTEVRGLLSYLQTLATIGTIAPMLGLLGTVTGMIRAFMVIQELGGKVNAVTLAGGIWEAMLTTAFGLIVAIPVMAAHSWLIAEVERQEIQLQNGGVVFFRHLLSKNHQTISGEGNIC